MSVLPPRALSLPEKEALRGWNPHLYESFKKIEDWMRRMAQWSSIAQETIPTAGAGAIPIYAESTTDTDGTATVFVFLTPIKTLLIAWAGAGPISPTDCSVVSGNLVLAFAPGDPANVGLVKVSALYVA